MFALEIHTKCVIAQLPQRAQQPQRAPQPQRARAPGPPAEPQRARALARVRMDPSVLQRESNDPNQLNEELYIHCALDFATHNYVKLRHITIDIQEN